MPTFLQLNSLKGSELFIAYLFNDSRSFRELEHLVPEFGYSSHLRCDQFCFLVIFVGWTTERKETFDILLVQRPLDLLQQRL